MVTRRDVVDFLDMFKGAMMLDFFQVKHRQKNIQGLLDLGLSCGEQKEIILGLTPDDYVAGPKPDDTDWRKEVWEFGKNVEGTEVYIKLRLSGDPKRRNVHHALVWSFHPAEYSMRYPLRGGRK